MENQSLRCNNRIATGGLCRKELKQAAVVTTCSHVFCIECAESTGFRNDQSKNRKCLVCAQLLPNVDDAAETNLQPTDEYKTSVLCGLDPTTIMECASSALSFWNYQMLQETAYQQHLLLALSKKYTGLSDSVNKIVDEANHEIDGLHVKLEEMSHTNADLHQKNLDLADSCRDRGKKYGELRKGYETLKKMYQHNQQNMTNEAVAEKAVQSFTTDPRPEAFDGLMKGKFADSIDDLAGPDIIFASHSFAPDTHAQQSRTFIRPINGGQHGAEGSKTHPQRAFLTNDNAFANVHSHRSPLTNTFRPTANRSQHSSSTNRANHSFGASAHGPGHRHSARTGGAHANHGRHHSAASYGGISAGMKVGGAIVDPISQNGGGNLPTRNLHHH